MYIEATIEMAALDTKALVVIAFLNVLESTFPTAELNSSPDKQVFQLQCTSTTTTAINGLGSDQPAFNGKP